MQTVNVTIEGIAPYSQSRYVDKEEHPKVGKETADDYEKRTWQARVHLDEDGVPYMPPMALKKSLDAASAYLGKIPGERNATYVKRFKSGLLVTDNIPLWENGKRVSKVDDFEGEWLFLDATGGKGGQGGTRVKRRMPRLRKWSAKATIYLIDEVITRDVLERALVDAGRFVGIGRFRPQVGGFYGRFVGARTQDEARRLRELRRHQQRDRGLHLLMEARHQAGKARAASQARHRVRARPKGAALLPSREGERERRVVRA
jgi:hypothetical protein